MTTAMGQSHTAAMDAAIITFRILAASQVILFLGALLLSENPPRVRAFATGLSIGVLAYLVLPLVYAQDMNVVALALFSNLVPALVLLFTWAVFEDSTRPPAAITALCAGYVLLVLLHLISKETASGERLLLALQLAKLVLVAYAMALLWRGRETDLVERRLRLRRYLLVGLMLSVAAVVGAELVSGWSVPKAVEATGMAAIFALSLAMNLAFLKVNPGFALGGGASPRQLDAATDPLADKLRDLMTGERLYADHDLRIAGLAGRLGVPEYQLRRLINGQLGYSNFNQFVNGYRLDEAARRLVEEPRQPVLTLALDVGFRSISSFNSAFRARFACSPTQYRKAALTDSR